jgi:anti-sigma factor ChrR (cupin superfamily)
MSSIEKHQDLRQDATVKTVELGWIASPAAGVERCIFERQGGETAIRATSLVRFAPESYFPAHTHALGEEFLVLEGVFSDNTGDYGAGTYVRNPPGSSHSPHTKDGCTIFVKLEQFDGDDLERVVLDTNDQALWTEDDEGAMRLSLHTFADEHIELLKVSKGHALPAAIFETGAEYLVVSGAIDVGGQALGPRSWLRRAGHFEQRVTATAETFLYRKTGHLGPSTPATQ